MKRLPKITSVRAAEAFVAGADLTTDDLSDMRAVRFEFAKNQMSPVVDPMKARAKKALAAVRVHHAAKMRAAKRKADKQE